MTPLEALIVHSHSLSSFDPNDDRESLARTMASKYGVASSGEKTMIMAAFSLDRDLEEFNTELNLGVPPLRLYDLTGLDDTNMTGVLVAVAARGQNWNLVPRILGRVQA